MNISAAFSFGITAGAHRFWCHKSYKAKLPLLISTSSNSRFIQVVTLAISNKRIKFRMHEHISWRQQILAIYSGENLYTFSVVKMCSAVRLLILAYLLGVCKGASIKTYKISSRDEIRSNHSSEMKSYMNSSALYCEDFYEYACGNYNNLHPLALHQDEISSFEKLASAETEVWREFLQSPVDETDLGEAFRKTRDFFESCMNMDKIEERGITPLIEYLRNLGGWPAIDSNWTGNGIGWYKLHAEMESMDEEKFLSYSKGKDMFNATRKSLYILYPTMTLGSRSYYQNESKVLSAYKIYLRDALKAFNVAEDKIEAEFNDILDFELKMSNIVMDYNYTDDLKGFKITTLGDLQKNFTSIDFQKYLTEYVSEFEFNSSEQVIIYGDYLEKLDALIKNTSKRTIFNYLGWHAASELMLFLGNKFLEIRHNVNAAFVGEKSMEPRLEMCISKSRDYFEPVLGSAYAERKFNQEAKEDAKDFLMRVKDSFRQFIEESDWIDSQSKNNLNLKLDHLKLEVGYPDLVLNTTRVNELYENITIKSDDYFGNMVELRTTSINTTWPLHFTSANAMYVSYLVQMFITALMFQPPFYHKDLPKFINFAGIGSLTAHEMNHAFDTDNIKIDHKGDFNNILSNASLAVYKEKEKCFVEKYGNYSYNGVNLDGNRVLGEVVADDVGIKAAFLAYNKWLEEKKNSAEVQNEELIGFLESKEKMFFLSYAQVFCKHISENSFPHEFETDEHTIHKYRVNGVLSNLKSFSDAYSCPVGSGMNPERKCAIW